MDEIEPKQLDQVEKRRVYHYGDGRKLEISNVTHFLARPSGTHRLKTVDGMYWMVPAGFLGVEIEVGALTV